MHDSIQYDPIQGQGLGHKPFKFGNPAIFKSISAILNGSWQQIPKLGHNDYIWSGQIFDIFCVTWLKLAETSVTKSRPSVSYEANFYSF